MNCEKTQITPFFDLIAFDADDTLWQNESLYQRGRESFRELLTKYKIPDGVDAQIDAVEIRNLPYYGYGAMGFILSLIEAGIHLTDGRFSSSDVLAMLDYGKQMLAADAELFTHAEETLARVSASHPLMLITKGDLNHQLSKINRSGLKGYFRNIEVVNDKTSATYAAILEQLGIPAERFLMIGNSLRSDILPVLELGGWAIYIPQQITWMHEQSEAPKGYGQRLIQASHLGQLPQLIQSLLQD